MVVEVSGTVVEVSSGTVVEVEVVVVSIVVVVLSIVVEGGHVVVVVVVGHSGFGFGWRSPYASATFPTSEAIPSAAKFV